VLFSPGWTGTRNMSELGANLASHGYVVVGVDHYDAIRTAFPDGTYLQGDTGAGGTAGFQDRVNDLGFILDELTRWNTNDPLFAGRLDLTKVAVGGGSLGGVTVAEFGRIDPRCRAVIGLDPGGFSTAPQLTRVQQPVLEINASNNSSSPLYNMASQGATWFQISSTDHLLIAGIDWYWAWHPENVAGDREVARTINAYTLWFLNKYLKGSSDPVPPLAQYPRVINFKQK